MSQTTPRPGRVAPTPIFAPTVRKRRLLSGPKEEAWDDTASLIECGAWLKARREERGLSQEELCRLGGLRGRSYVSAIEAGRARIKPEHFRSWAEPLDMPLRDFAVKIVSYYSPIVYDVLLKDEEPTSRGGAA